MHGCEGKKTALLQPDFFIGIANVLFCAGAVVFPMRPSGAKSGGKKN
jgi:hypothetical protein